MYEAKDQMHGKVTVRHSLANDFSYLVGAENLPIILMRSFMMISTF